MAEVSSNQRIFATLLTCARATWAIYKQRCSHMNRHECICIYRYMYLKTAALQFFARSNESHFHSFSLPLSELVSTFLSLFLFSSISLSLYVQIFLSLSLCASNDLVLLLIVGTIDHFALLSRNLGWATLNIVQIDKFNQ